MATARVFFRAAWEDPLTRLKTNIESACCAMNLSYLRYEMQPLASYTVAMYNYGEALEFAWEQQQAAERLYIKKKVTAEERLGLVGSDVPRNTAPEAQELANSMADGGDDDFVHWQWKLLLVVESAIAFHHAVASMEEQMRTHDLAELDMILA